MKNNIAALVVGFLFALGLGISGMTQPQKIINFLDITGNFDPSLIFVMLGAVGVHMGTFHLIRNRHSPLLATGWHVPIKKEITPTLIAGSFIFGVGWALGGFCPGPGVTALASFDSRAFLFVGGMLIGMFLFAKLDHKLKFKK